MKKIILFVVAACLAISMAVSSHAEKFTLREGLCFWITLPEAEAILKKESGSENYEFVPVPSDLIEDPNYAKAIWMEYVNGIDLGDPENERVEFALEGTTKYGLQDINYFIYLNSSKDDDVYKRATQLIAQIEKKYGVKMKTYKDKWKSRKSIKVGDYVFQKSALLEKYDDTWVTIRIHKIEDGYCIGIQYVPQKKNDIIKEIEDGSYFVETPYGL